MLNNLGGNLNTFIDRIFRQDGGFTSYLGTAIAPWDVRNVYHLYRVSDLYNDHVDMYVRMSDLNIVWIHNYDNGIVSYTPKGFEPMYFNDSDFVVQGCPTTLQASATDNEESENLGSIFLAARKDLFERPAVATQ